MDVAMLLIKAVVLGMIVTGVLGFFLWRYLSGTIEKDVSRLHKETETVRGKQSELNEKIKQANEELAKRRSEADALVARMSDDAENKAKEEREKILAKARQEAEEILMKANRTKDDIRKVIAKEMDMKAMDYTAVILNEVLSEKQIKALDESMILGFLEELAKVDMEMIGPEITTAEITTVAPLAEPLKNQLLDIIGKKLDRPVTLNPSFDPKIIGGVVLRFGSLCLNGSLANMIKEAAMQNKDKIDRGLL